MSFNPMDLTGKRILVTGRFIGYWQERRPNFESTWEPG